MIVALLSITFAHWLSDSSTPVFFLGEDIGLPQEIPQHLEQEVQQVIASARDYLKNVIYPDPRMAAVKDKCRNNYQLCAAWAVAGEFSVVSVCGLRKTN